MSDGAMSKPSARDDAQRLEEIANWFGAQSYRPGDCWDIAATHLRDLPKRLVSDGVGGGFREKLLDDDGPVLLEIREAISDEMPAFGFRNEESEEVYANDPNVEALGNDVSDRVKTVLTRLLSDESQPLGGGEEMLREALEAEVEKLRHDGEIGEAIVPVPAGVRLHTADRLQAILDANPSPASGEGPHGIDNGDLSRWILDALELGADDPSDPEASRAQRTIQAAIESWFRSDVTQPASTGGGEEADVREQIRLRLTAALQTWVDHHREEGELAASSDDNVAAKQHEVAADAFEDAIRYSLAAVLSGTTKKPATPDQGGDARGSSGGGNRSSTRVAGGGAVADGPAPEISEPEDQSKGCGGSGFVQQYYGTGSKTALVPCLPGCSHPDCPNRDQAEMPETVSIVEHEGAVEDAAWKAINIYVKSVAEAESSVPDCIMGADEEVWSIPGERKDRTRLVSYYASEMGVDFAQVKCTRRHMCLATDAIHEVAAELAAEVVASPDEYAEEPIAYTWSDEGWTYEDCEPDAPGAIAMYRCEIKADQPKEEGR